MKRIAAGMGAFATVLSCFWTLAPGEDAEKQAGEAYAAEAIRYGPSRELAKLADREINESSGIACGRVNEGVFWTHNDAGNPPMLYAFDREGKSRGSFFVKGVRSTDWEDIASFRRDKRAFLIIADVGDNFRLRREYALYVVAEPVLDHVGRGPVELEALTKIRFRYEDGPHNCESMAIDVVEDIVYLVEKTEAPQCRVYAMSMPKEDTGEVLVAKAIATLRLPTTTGMDISPDGRRAVVLTYGDAYEYTRDAKERWPDAFARGPRRLHMPSRAQGESICYGPDGKSLYLTSEKVPTPLLEVPAIEKGAPAGTKPAE